MLIQPLQRRLIAIGSTLVLASLAGHVHANSIVIEHATILVDPTTIQRDATVLIRGNTISAVGSSGSGRIRVPKGTRTINARGKIVTAGLIDASSRLGLVEVILEPTSVEGRFASGWNTVHASYHVSDGFNPSSVYIPIARTGGITSAIITPTGGLISGLGAWHSMDGRLPTTTRSPAIAVYASLGNQALGSARGSRGMAIARIRQILDDAKLYAQRKRAFDRNQVRKLVGSRLVLESLLPVIRGTIPFVVRAHRAADIVAAVRLAKEHGVRLIVEGGTEAWRVAQLLAEANVGVILDPTANLPRGFDRIYVRNDAAALLSAAGVTVAISTLGDAANSRTLRQLAGIAVARGMTRPAALAAITTAPAALFGVQNRGTVQAGQIADLVVWSGDPLETSTKVETMLIGGVEQSNRTRQRLLFDRYRAPKTTR